MAELLVCAQDRAGTTDATKLLRGGWRRGQIVAVQSDGHAWGRREGLPRFVRIRLPGVTVAQVQRFMAARTTVDAFTGRREVAARRQWRVRLSDLPAAARVVIRETGVLTVDWRDFRDHLRHEVTGLSAPDLTPASLP